MAFNAMGYRGALPPLQKSPGEFRILALGDSVTFGTGLSVSENWPGQLREPGITVINGGVPLTDLRQLRLAYEQQWSPYAPDAVTVLVTGNMVALEWMRRHDPASLPHNGYLDEPPIEGWRLRAAKIRRAASALCLSAFASISTRVMLYATGVTSHNINPDEPHGLIFSFGWRQGGLDPQRAEEAWRLTETDLVTLSDSVKKRGAKLVVAFARRDSY